MRRLTRTFTVVRIIRSQSPKRATERLPLAGPRPQALGPPSLRQPKKTCSFSRVSNVWLVGGWSTWKTRQKYTVVRSQQWARYLIPEEQASSREQPAVWGCAAYRVSSSAFGTAEMPTVVCTCCPDDVPRYVEQWRRFLAVAVQVCVVSHEVSPPRAPPLGMDPLPSRPA